MNSSVLISRSTESDRAVFYKKTYTHVALAILAFIVVESILLKVVPEELILKMLGGRFIWLGILGPVSYTHLDVYKRQFISSLN